MDKQQAVELAQERFERRIAELEQHILTVQQSANAESKSSMGDKYETGRAMAQNEVFMLSTQLQNMKQELGKFTSLDYAVASEACAAGSLIKTSNGWFLLSAALGKVVVEGLPCMCISLNSPLGQALLGRRREDQFSVNGKEAIIMEIQ